MPASKIKQNATPQQGGKMFRGLDSRNSDLSNNLKLWITEGLLRFYDHVADSPNPALSHNQRLNIAL